MDISYRPWLHEMPEPMFVATRKWAAATVIIAVLWLGMLLGVSFVATPAKFLAESLQLAVALEVGRHTFAVFNKIEWLLTMLLIVAGLGGDRGWPMLGACSVMVLFMAAESFWLLPLLDERVGMIISGQQPPPSILHKLYIAFEVAKVFLLIFVSFVVAQGFSGQSSSSYSDALRAR